MHRSSKLVVLILLMNSFALQAQKSANWTTHPDITVSNNGSDLLKNSSGTANAWVSGVASLESLGYAEDGYVEATITETNTFRFFGFSTDDVDDTQSDIEYAIHLSGTGRIYINENGPQKQDPNIIYATGDKIRLERKDGYIKYYYISGSGQQELYTSTVKTNAPLYVDFSFKTPSASLENVQVSDNFYNAATEPHPNAGSSTHPEWKNPTGIDFRGTSIVKALPTSGLDEAGASSILVLNPSSAGWVEASLSQTSTARAIGFSESPTAALQSGLKYGINISSVGELGILEDGIQIHNTGINYQLEDIVRIERSVSGDISYILKRDVGGTIQETDLYPGVTEQFIAQTHVSITFFSAGARLDDIVFSSEFADPSAVVPNSQSAFWTDIENLHFFNEIIAKTGESQWGNSGAASIAYLSPGVNGWIQVSASETHTRRAFGLSESNIDSDIQTIDYAIQFVEGGIVSVLESGQAKYSSTGNFTYTTGDVFRIERVGTEIRYIRNNETSPFYTSLLASNSRLVADIAFNDNGATLSNVQFSESFENPQGGGYWSKNNADGTVYYENAIAIGRNSPVDDYLLSVQGKIITQRVLVTLQNWADSVFEEGYDLKSLAYVKQFIRENGHLPDVPSEKEVLQNGVELGEMNAILLRKIEELTLYMIKQNEELSKQNEELLEQNKKIKALEAELEGLKKN